MDRSDPLVFHTLYGGPGPDVVTVQPLPNQVQPQNSGQQQQGDQAELVSMVPRKKVHMQPTPIHLQKDSISLDLGRMIVRFRCLGSKKLTKINSTEHQSLQKPQPDDDATVQDAELEGTLYELPVTETQISRHTIDITLHTKKCSEQTLIHLEQQHNSIQSITQKLHWLDKKKKSCILEEIYDDRECVICLERPADCFVLPCRHKAMCFACAQILTTSSKACPICRDEIKFVCKIEE